MQKIIPHLWFDKEAKEAANFYATVFPNTAVVSVHTITGTPSGDCDIVSFDINGVEFQAISAGPYFKINPSVSFMVNFDPSQDADAGTRIDEIWGKLIDGGKILMPIQEYPFSSRYGWVEDKFGVSWQLILTNPEGEPRPFIVPSLLFVGDAYGKAQEASDFYLSLFKDGKRGTLATYPAGAEPNREGAVMFTDFMLGGVWLCAMDGGGEHAFAFNEGVSLIVNCDSQDEIDHFWNSLSAVPESEQCGWVKDRYGLSWQIVPKRLGEMMNDADPARRKRVTAAMLAMKRLDIAKLEEVYAG